MIINRLESDQGGFPHQQAFLSDANRNVCILHIEDDPSFADLVAEFLARNRSYFTVITETDPHDGIKRVCDDAVDCVVCDYEMPGLNGLEVLQEVRAESPQLPFILLR